MKKQFFKGSFVALCLLATLGACSGKGQQQQVVATPNEYESSADVAEGIQQMQPYNYSDTTEINGHIFHYTINRVADESLPPVVDDEGVTYLDNRYTLTILRDGQPYFERSFTKSSFESYLSTEFQQKGVLDGMIYDNSLPGLCFVASVTLPQSDMISPLLLHIGNDGAISIETDLRSENDF